MLLSRMVSLLTVVWACTQLEGRTPRDVNVSAIAAAQDSVYYEIRWLPPRAEPSRESPARYHVSIHSRTAVVASGVVLAPQMADTLAVIQTLTDTLYARVISEDRHGRFSMPAMSLPWVQLLLPPAPPDSVAADTIARSDTVDVDRATVAPNYVAIHDDSLAVNGVHLMWWYWRAGTTEPVLCVAIELARSGEFPPRTRVERITRAKCPNGRPSDPEYVRVASGRVWESAALAATVGVTIR